MHKTISVVSRLTALQQEVAYRQFPCLVGFVKSILLNAGFIKKKKKKKAGRSKSPLSSKEPLKTRDQQPHLKSTCVPHCDFPWTQMHYFRSGTEPKEGLLSEDELGCYHKTSEAGKLLLTVPTNDWIREQNFRATPMNHLGQIESMDDTMT